MCFSCLKCSSTEYLSFYWFNFLLLQNIMVLVKRASDLPTGGLEWLLCSLKILESIWNMNESSLLQKAERNQLVRQPSWHLLQQSCTSGHHNFHNSFELSFFHLCTNCKRMELCTSCCNVMDKTLNPGIQGAPWGLITAELKWVERDTNTNTNTNTSANANTKLQMNKHNQLYVVWSHFSLSLTL